MSIECMKTQWMEHFQLKCRQWWMTQRLESIQLEQVVARTIQRSMLSQTISSMLSMNMKFHNCQMSQLGDGSILHMVMALRNM
jgi:hypothetical protein